MENLDNSVAALPKKRGRKPGSKNKVSTKRTSKKSILSERIFNFRTRNSVAFERFEKSHVEG